MFQLDQKRFSCPKKTQARYDTIIKRYRCNFYDSIPQDRQFWSMCGQNADQDGLIENSEYHQLITSGLILPHQYHGVELNQEIHNINRTIDGPNWYHGDFFTAMLRSNNFAPAIINADFTRTPKKEAAKFAAIMDFVTQGDIYDVMLVGNFCLRFISHDAKDGNEIISKLNRQPLFQRSVHKWNYDQTYYQYPGTNSKASMMGTVVFWMK